MSFMRGEAMSGLAERLWSKVDRRGPDECWPWIGSLSHGRPSMSVDKTSVSPRKVAWEVTHGDRPPKDRHVEVTCGNAMCMNPAHLSYLTIEERFWARVEKTEGGCWIWKGRILPRKEYGVFEYRDRGRKVAAQVHRFSYELAHGKIVGHVPGDAEHEICVLHRCDNPPCVNPDHLWLGTDADNIADCIAKGRNSRGEEHAEKLRRAREAKANMQRLANQAMGVR